ncbi:MAG: hypothetical protein R3182_08080 [Draconibacterium sp.]|nr:hypothetical protein [Draconibacterium sp.]
MRIIFIVFLLLAKILSIAQDNPCPCCDEQHLQFDFWKGDWNVYDTTNTLVGTNLVVKLENGCILQENWKSINGGSGSSYNYFNKTDSTWNQVWIDSQGGVLELKGSFVGNKMTLKSELTKGSKGGLYYNQISWTPNSDGTVTQLWEIYAENGKLINTSFKGIYKRKTS